MAGKAHQGANHELGCMIQQALFIYSSGIHPLFSPSDAAQDVLAAHAKVLLIRQDCMRQHFQCLG